MPSVRIPALLRAYTDGLRLVGVEGGTVGEAMEALAARYPALRLHLYADGGELRPFVNLFLGEANVKDLQGLETRLEEGDVPSGAAGWHSCAWPSPTLKTAASITLAKMDRTRWNRGFIAVLLLGPLRQPGQQPSCNPGCGWTGRLSAYRFVSTASDGLGWMDGIVEGQ